MNLQPNPLNSAARPRIHGLDTLRSIAIVLVFMYHYMCFVSHEATFGWASVTGWVGVDLFFVLSGYLIGNQLFAGLASGRALSLPSFYARRLLRTLPNYYVVLAFYFLFPVVMGGNSPPALWRFLTFTQNYQLTPGTAFSHAWSLCIEEQFYLLLPAVVLLAARFGKSIRLAWMLLGGLMLAGVVLRSVLWIKYGRIADGAIGNYYPNVYYSTFCRGDEFLPGVALALLKNFHRDQWERLMRHGQAILVAGLVAAALLAWLIVNFYFIENYGYGYFMSGFGYSLIALCFGALVLAALSPASLLHRVRVPGASHLALWSYAIYLSHKPLATIIATQLAPFGIAPGSVTAILIISAAALLVGWVMYNLVERPFMRLRDRRFPSNFSPRPHSAMATAYSGNVDHP
ncbi:acyltransferase family protein [Collimonas arenae]|nr:acyltransferase [Collimonas arenae]